MKKYSAYNDRTGDCAPGNIAKDRLKRAIQSERMKLSDDVMDMMQSDLKTLIEKYLGTSLEESDMVLEISKLSFPKMFI
jgi:septum formation topological specificity factor MinE